MKRPFFSIIIATYNSEQTLPYTLQSIRNQDFDQNELEVLVVDGGSTDRTRNIAEEYGATILENEKRLPEYAKLVGVKNARGKYLIRMDSDEEFTYSKQLEDKKNFYMHHPDVKVVIVNKMVRGREEICGVSAGYMNVLGDPFSYFIYRTKKDRKATSSKYVKYENCNEIIFKFEPDDVFPLADSGTCSYSLDYIKENYPQEYLTIEFTCSTYDRIMQDTGLCGCVKKDIVKHNCKSDLCTYFKKLKFRVINNVFNKKESGFSSKNNAKSNNRVVLFCLYALFIPLPILDGCRLAIVYKDWTFILHFVYLYYVCVLIVISYLQLLLGKKIDNSTFG